MSKNHKITNIYINFGTLIRNLKKLEQSCNIFIN